MIDNSLKVDGEESITATELVRNLSVVIDNVRISRKSFMITKGSQQVAVLSPPTRTGVSMGKLASLLRALPKLGDDGVDLTNDLILARNQTIDGVANNTVMSEV